MDLDAFKRTVDTLGGLNVEMPTVLSASRDAMPVGNLEMTGVAGTRRHLTGSSALRFMQTGTAGALGDIDQMQREQEVLFALQRAVLQPQAFVRIPSLVATVGGSVPTNFPYNQVPALARALASVPASGVRGASLDYASHAVTDYSSDGQHVLLPDWQRIDTIAQQVFSDPGLRQGGRVVVWNGSGVDGQAATLAEWLGQAGLPVLNVSSAPRDYARTSVVISAAASPRERYTANAVATLLQAPVVARRAQQGRDITVIIGHNFQDPSPQ
jgi:hypothetical protein